MSHIVLVLTNQSALGARWRGALRGHDVEILVRPVDALEEIPAAIACVLDAGAFPSGDALLEAAALASATGSAVAVELGRADSCDALVVEIAAGRVAASPEDVHEVAGRLARAAIETRDPRLEFVTLGPGGESLLVVLSSGAVRLEPRPLSPEDDGCAVASITLVDDGQRAEIVTVEGSVFHFHISLDEVLDGTSVGRRVRELRAKAGLTQAELAKRTGIHRPNIARVEAGRHMPSLETVVRLAEALGTSPARILEGTH